MCVVCKITFSRYMMHGTSNTEDIFDITAFSGKSSPFDAL
jgi:hypothetical protein